jgi:monofunctional biosynthetic peptidoglycan transglycosylase
MQFRMRTVAFPFFRILQLVRRLAYLFTITLLILMIALLAVLWTARTAVRPAPGDWATTLRAGPLSIEVGVAALIQWGTTPWIAQQMHGRTLPTRMGAVHVSWDASQEMLSLHCQPCTLRSSSWGGEPLHLHGATMTVNRQGGALRGTLSSGAVSAHWTGTLRRNGLGLHIDLPPTPLRDGYALFADAIPELASAQIDGTFSLRATLELPSKALTITPRLEGLAVQGLGTEDWAQAQSQCSQGLSESAASVAITTHGLLARAVVAAEDQRFFEHPGYDLQEMTQALHSNQQAKARLRGASTLTQQVAKLLVTGDERSPVRKLRELLYALEMERTLGKARILHLYLEHAPWGAGICGARSAAQAYFGKPIDKITLPQAVWLAAMLHNPRLEAQHWRANGHINRERAQWVAANLRPMRPDRRTQLRLALSHAEWQLPSTVR